MTNIDSRTRHLAVNAAFLKDIKDDNHDLKAIVDQIAPLSEHYQTAINHWPELVGLLEQLCDQLALHFSLEEAYGYFDDAVNHAPQLSVNAECLRGQHPSLFKTIRGLADKVLEVNTDNIEHVQRFLNGYQSFQQQFAAHEEAELKLILDAMDDDLGVGD
ncbi:MAG: hemerythrin domain-containing protein [Planctomycetaceae bacterium]|nr:hemerythrin domain-containing protein [Planctomycetaceae bacterium]